VNVALGGIDSSTGGLVGARRGGANVDITEESGCAPLCGPTTTHRDQIAFIGDIASLAGPDGSHFMGNNNPNIVIGFDTTGTHNIGRDIPLDPNSSSVEQQSGSTHHIGIGVGTLPPQDQTFNGEFKGYAAGMVQSEVPASNFVNVVASASPEDFAINFDKTANTLSALLTVRDAQGRDGATNAYTIGFGDSSEASANKSAYIDNLHYAAIEAGPNGTHVDSGDGFYDHATSTAYLVSGDQLNVTKFFPDTFAEDDNGNRPFCQGCDFLKWGAWGARVNFGNSSASQFVDNIHLGWWVAGDLADGLDIDALAALNATARYDGHVLGDVAKLVGNQWQTYVAAGDLIMNWEFSCRRGDLTISNFDSRSFGTGPRGLSQPIASWNQFNGVLTQLSGPELSNVSGSVAGSFVRGAPVQIQGAPTGNMTSIRGVAGNFNIDAQGYRAGGIFAGAGVPSVHGN